ncbi:glucosidase II beta subunit-like-domain-containing protein [Polychytrium aggregatum]|uniref:glucosidase II beta subunit-like-domain-containing protein n=1 Tax=Polychytrium aggregatum TaxID=110093 RepID=UPI0022FE7830|nr:glucosidase II beta subunit-like-domain-containing protein [Polychytrium aggregatum]KAI9201820.1 glucosidase II beta subunit-like-domain-containing protein [Polychytrium aggregatum]
MKIITPAIACFVLVGGSLAKGKSSIPRHLRGVAPDHLKAYESTNDLRFLCLDGSKHIPHAAVNDDYCDCSDGSDEPGTSACSNGRFYCINQGHVGASIPSSRVNDGICDEDCCDGTDEYASSASCPNTCSQQARIAAEHQKKEFELNSEGARIKAVYLSERASKVAHRQIEIPQLEEGIKESKAAVETLKAQLEQLEAALKEYEPLAQPDSLNSCHEKLQQLLGSIEFVEKQDAESRAKHLEKIFETKRQVLLDTELQEGHAELNRQKSIDIQNEVHQLKGQVRAAEDKIRTDENTLRELKRLDEFDFGSEGVFEALDKQCFSYTATEYTYEFCLFNKASQKKGGATTNLGSFSRWAGTEHHPYTQLKFENGEQCWNGPNRSLQVNLECGTENKIDSVAEPNKCEYVMRFRTPAACKHESVPHHNLPSGGSRKREEL